MTMTMTTMILGPLPEMLEPEMLALVVVLPLLLVVPVTLGVPVLVPVIPVDLEKHRSTTSVYLDILL